MKRAWADFPMASTAHCPANLNGKGKPMAMNLSSGGGGRRRGRGGRRAPMADINVTPFVDVMLVLLIIFMVTAPMLVTGVPLELPETRANSLDQTQEPVQVSLDDEGRVYIDDVETLMLEIGRANV